MVAICSDREDGKWVDFRTGDEAEGEERFVRRLVTIGAMRCVCVNVNCRESDSPSLEDSIWFLSLILYLGLDMLQCR